jgi:hypothetical protein
VNKSENTRVDLILSNDLHLYLRATDFKERQKWLVAFATQKATYPSSSSISPPIHQKNSPLKGRTITSLLLPLKSNSNEDLINDDKTFQSSTTTSNSSCTPTNFLQQSYQNLTSIDATNLLKIKQSELKLYCDLLAQQTYEIKNIILSVILNIKHSEKRINFETVTDETLTSDFVIKSKDNSKHDSHNDDNMSECSAHNLSDISLVKNYQLFHQNVINEKDIPKAKGNNIKFETIQVSLK